MPETQEGRELREALVRKHGSKRGTALYYKTINRGELKGTHRRSGSVGAPASSPGISSKGEGDFKLKKPHRDHISEGLQRHYRSKKSKGYNPAAHSV